MRTGKSELRLRYVVWRRLALLALLCAALATLAYSDALHGALVDVVDVAGELIAGYPMLGPTVFVLIAAATAMFAFVSVAVVVPVAIVTWGGPASMALLWAGWILGGACTYAAGRFLGRPAVRWLSAGASLHRFENLVHRNASFLLVLLLQLALPSEIPGYVLGLARYRFRVYLLALALAELPYAVATVYLGASFVEGHGLAILGFGFGLLLLSSLSLYLLHRRLRQEASTDVDAPKPDVASPVLPDSAAR